MKIVKAEKELSKIMQENHDSKKAEVKGCSDESHLANMKNQLNAIFGDVLDVYIKNYLLNEEKSNGQQRNYNKRYGFIWDTEFGTLCISEEALDDKMNRETGDTLDVPSEEHFLSEECKEELSYK